jgi:autotransporter translocation and assembly factor TamB
MALLTNTRRRLMGEVVVDKTEENELDLEIGIRSKLEAEYSTRLQKEINDISKKMTEDNKKIVAEAIERFRKEMTPPNEQDIQKLLNQEYVEFKIDIRYQAKGGEDKWKTKNFVIQEVPNKVEKRIYASIKKILVPFATEIASITMNMLEGDAAKKVVQIMNTFEPLLDTMVSIATIVLNPYDEDAEVDEDWVRENLSSTRIVKIVNAQIECNRMRDFFSLLFQGSKLLK